MFDQDYSKKVWIIGIVMAIGCIIMDVCFLFSSDALMKNTVWMSLPIAVFVLYKCIVGLIQKIKSEQEEQ